MYDNGLETLPIKQPEQVVENRNHELSAAEAMIDAAFADMAQQMDPSDPVKTYIQNHLEDHFAHGPKGVTSDN